MAPGRRATRSCSEGSSHLLRGSHAAGRAVTGTWPEKGATSAGETAVPTEDKRTRLKRWLDSGKAENVAERVIISTHA